MIVVLLSINHSIHKITIRLLVVPQSAAGQCGLGVDGGASCIPLHQLLIYYCQVLACFEIKTLLPPLSLAFHSLKKSYPYFLIGLRGTLLI